MDLRVTKCFSTAKIRDDHKQVESCETGNTSELLETALKISTAEYQGRFTAI